MGIISIASDHSVSQPYISWLSWLYYHPPPSIKMKFSAVLGGLLGAAAVSAAPGTAKRQERAARLMAERQARKSGLMIPDISETDAPAIVNGTQHASYSTNVCIPRL